MPSLDEIKKLVGAGGLPGTPEPAAEEPAAEDAEKPKPKPKAKKVEPKAEADEPAGLRKYKVQLKDNPELTVEAFDRLDAIAAYKRECGIISTVHEFRVEKA